MSTAFMPLDLRPVCVFSHLGWCSGRDLFRSAVREAIVVGDPGGLSPRLHGPLVDFTEWTVYLVLDEGIEPDSEQVNRTGSDILVFQEVRKGILGPSVFKSQGTRGRVQTGAVSNLSHARVD